MRRTLMGMRAHREAGRLNRRVSACISLPGSR
jgi:hypothetical protein